ncbi:hypothetical protein DSO57_1031668 [Entomophthora muscae]|uniref:Uncharacterized protein n=1 Tax=Entomophthora muscae TaxID=34485 RepID=A0ACC2SD72_9FUNG|nr:hypothetical protein DSO57_1031668 [Entomophthora muscae]
MQPSETDGEFTRFPHLPTNLSPIQKQKEPDFRWLKVSAQIPIFPQHMYTGYWRETN